MRSSVSCQKQPFCKLTQPHSVLCMVELGQVFVGAHRWANVPQNIATPINQFRRKKRLWVLNANTKFVIGFYMGGIFNHTHLY